MNWTAFAISWMLVIASAIWVNMDAKGWKEAGAKVETSPTEWCVGVVLLWIVFFPMYLIRRSKYKKSVKQKSTMEEQNKTTGSSEHEKSKRKAPVAGIVIGIVAFAVIFGLMALIGSSSSNSGSPVASVPSGCNNPNLEQQAQTIDFQQLTKDPTSFNGTIAKFTGQVLEIHEANGQGILRLAVVPLAEGIWSPNVNDVVWIDYQGSNKSVQGDVVNVYGLMTGTKTYTSEANYNITVPSMTGCVIEEASSSPSVSETAPSAPVVIAPTQPKAQNPAPMGKPVVVQSAPAPQAPTPPPTPKAWHTVTTVTTATTKNTPPFTIQGTEWRATWSCQAALPVNTTPAVYAKSTTGYNSDKIADPNSCPSGDVTYLYDGPGDFYLDVEIYSAATMTVTIEDYY
jgi:hypothetical protein